MKKQQLIPKTDDEKIVVLWHRRRTCREIAKLLAGRWTGPAVRSRIEQLRRMGVPIDYRNARFDLQLASGGVNVDRLTELAEQTRSGLR